MSSSEAMDGGEWPFLTKCNFQAAFSFSKALREKIGKDQKKKHAVSMLSLIDPELLERPSAPALAFEPGEDLEESIKKLLHSFVTSLSDITRTELLMGSRPEPPRRAQAGWVEFIDRYFLDFKSMAVALEIPEEAQISWFVENMPSFIKAAVEKSLKLHGSNEKNSLKKVATLASAVAREADHAAMWRSEFSEKAPAKEEKKNPPRIKEEKSKERDRRYIQGLCFQCGKAGHQRANCPELIKTEAPPVVAAAAPLAMQQHALRTQLKPNPKFQGQEWDSGKKERKDRPSAKIIGCIETQEKHAEIEVSFRRPDGSKDSFWAVIDSAADRSIMNEEFVKELKLTPIDCEAMEFEESDGRTSTSCRKIIVETILAPGGDSRKIEFWVTKSSPAGRFALVGLHDLHGYAIEFLDSPQLYWMGKGDVGDQVDPDIEAGMVIPIASSKPAWREVEVGSMAKSPEEKETIEKILAANAVVFEPPGAEPAKMPSFHVKLIPGAVPMRMKFRFLTPERSEFMKEEVKRWLQLGYAVSSHGPFASPVVVVKKADGSHRFCIDYKRINDITVRDMYPSPDIQEIFQWIAGHPFKAKLDMKSAYNQVPIDQESQEILAFITAEGLFRPTRMTMGPTNAPAHFQRCLNEAFSDMPAVKAFFDDITIRSKTFQEFSEDLKQFLGRCKELNIHLNASKCMVLKEELKLLGRLVGIDEIRPDPEDFRAIKELRAPNEPCRTPFFPGHGPILRKFCEGIGSESNSIVAAPEEGRRLEMDERSTSRIRQYHQSNH